jgi:hypothetical protein
MDPAAERVARLLRAYGEELASAGAAQAEGAFTADSAEIARLFQCKPHTVTVEAEQR